MLKYMRFMVSPSNSRTFVLVLCHYCTLCGMDVQ